MRLGNVFFFNQKSSHFLTAKETFKKYFEKSISYDTDWYLGISSGKVMVAIHKKSQLN